MVKESEKILAMWGEGTLKEQIQKLATNVKFLKIVKKKETGE